MKKPDNVDPFDTLGAVYEKMYEDVAESIHNATNKTAPLLHDWIEEAKHKAVELDELTEEDAKQLAEWLKRDFDDALNYLSETESELKDWLGFEASLIKSTIIQKLLEAADKTTVELTQMKKNLNQSANYKTGEITGPGSLICDECHKRLHFYKAGRIPPCPKCNSTSYHRIQND